MTTSTLYLSEEEDLKIEKLSKKWGLPKYKAIAKIIIDFEEQEDKQLNKK